jgi:hypothetical protein
MNEAYRLTAVSRGEQEKGQKEEKQSIACRMASSHNVIMVLE